MAVREKGIEVSPGNFVSDIDLKGMLKVSIVRSSIPSGEIEEIKLPKIPAGYWIIGRESVPGTNFFVTNASLIDDTVGKDGSSQGLSEGEMGKESCGKYRRLWFAEGRVNYPGEPILLVAGPDLHIVRELASSVTVKYREDGYITDPIEALKEGRIIRRESFDRGNYESIYREAYQVVEEEYEIRGQEHLYDEPQAAVATWDGKLLTVYTQCQDPFLLRVYLAALLNLPEKRIRVVLPSTGGALNGKLEDAILVAGYVSLVSFVTSLPAKLAYTREEDLDYTSKSYPVIARYRSAVDSNGDLMGLSVTLIVDSGAYETFGYDSLLRMRLASLGVYRCNDIHFEMYLVSTNKVPFGVMEGMGSPQGFSGIEIHSSRLAEIAQVDPFVWKKRNLISKGFILPSGYAIEEYETPLLVLERVVSISDFQRKYSAYEMAKKRRSNVESGTFPLRGIGLSLCFQPAGLPDYYEKKRKSSVILKFDRNRNITVFSSFFDYSGLERLIVSGLLEKYGFDGSRYIWELVDTQISPDTGPSLPVRRGMIMKPLLERGLNMLKRKRLNSIPPLSVKVSYRNPSRRRQPNKLPYSGLVWVGTVVEVEVDPITFNVAFRGIWVVTSGKGDKLDLDSSGTSEVPSLISEVEAGVMHGLGFVLGRRRNFKGLHSGENSFYVVRGGFTVREIPLKIDFLGGEKNSGCFNCTGEVGIVGVAPAFIAAVSQATGVYINKMPVAPSVIQDYIDSENAEAENVGTP